MDGPALAKEEGRIGRMAVLYVDVFLVGIRRGCGFRGRKLGRGILLYCNLHLPGRMGLVRAVVWLLAFLCGRAVLRV